MFTNFCSPLDTGAFTPEFGAQTPTFGDGIDIVRDLGGMQAACCGGTQDPRTWEYPRWPTWEPGETDEDYDRVMATTIKEKPVPEDPTQLPLKMEVHDDDRRGYGILVTWPRSVPFTDGKDHLTLWFSSSHYGSKEAAQKATWS